MINFHAKRVLFTWSPVARNCTNLIQIVQNYNQFYLYNFESNYGRFPRKACSILLPAKAGNLDKLYPNFTELLSILFICEILNQIMENFHAKRAPYYYLLKQGNLTKLNPNFTELLSILFICEILNQIMENFHAKRVIITTPSVLLPAGKTLRFLLWAGWFWDPHTVGGGWYRESCGRHRRNGRVGNPPSPPHRPPLSVHW